MWHALASEWTVNNSVALPNLDLVKYAVSTCSFYTTSPREKDTFQVQGWNRPESAPPCWPTNQGARELNATLNHWDSEVAGFIEKQTHVQRLPGNIVHGWESILNSGKQSISFYPSTLRWRWCTFWSYFQLSWKWLCTHGETSN